MVAGLVVSQRSALAAGRVATDVGLRSEVSRAASAFMQAGRDMLQVSDKAGDAASSSEADMIGIAAAVGSVVILLLFGARLCCIMRQRSLQNQDGQSGSDEPGASRPNV